MAKNPSKIKETPRVSARRKRDHVDIVVKKDIGFRTKTNGFERWDFIHNALPELDFTDIDTSAEYLGIRIACPLLVSCMTGGYSGGKQLNRRIAEVCEELRFPLGVGSQRQILEHRGRDSSFAIVREAAPTVPVLGNIGAAEVARLGRGEFSPEDFLRLVDVIRADGFTVHLNSLQELIQPEGNTRFKGVLRGVETLVKHLPCPIIVKEVGSGLSAEVIQRLLSVGVRYIDVAGAGGTSWARIEQIRRGNDKINTSFLEWGIPTVDSLLAARSYKNSYPELHITASGGINDGVTAAKALALGADLVGSARPFMTSLVMHGVKGLRSELLRWMEEIKQVMFLTGSATIERLSSADIIKRDV
jgi:isopentenyl-diphosphate Delta-isomerase